MSSEMMLFKQHIQLDDRKILLIAKQSTGLNIRIYMSVGALLAKD